MHDIWIPFSLVLLTVTDLVNANCPCPYIPRYGFIQGCATNSYAEVGDTISYHCSSYYQRDIVCSYNKRRTIYKECTIGYNVLGNLNRTCQENGTWSGTDPSCIRGCRCPVDPLLNDVCHKYSWKNYLSYNASLRYTCIDGYHIANANHYPDEYGVRCLHNGTLRERKPQCVKDVPCPCPPPVDGVILDRCNGTFSKRRFYYCNNTAGYYFEYRDYEILVCLGNGTVDRKPFCKKGCTCPVDPEPEDAHHFAVQSCQKYLRRNTFHRYACIEGYQVANSSLSVSEFGRTCSANGTLSELNSYCVKSSSCPCPSPVDGVIFSSCNGAFVGKLHYTCNTTADYYTLESQPNILCSQNGTIVYPPVCTKKVPCPCPSPVDGVIFSDCNGTFSDRLHYSCNATAGYFTYRTNIVCLRNGTIANQPVCTKGCSCNALRPQNWTSTCRRNTQPIRPGNSISIRCDPGTNFNSLTRIWRFCYSGGQWSRSDPVCIPDSESPRCQCPSPPVNGTIFNCNGSVLAGSAISFACPNRVHPYRGKCLANGNFSGIDFSCSEEEGCECPFPEFYNCVNKRFDVRAGYYYTCRGRDIQLTCLAKTGEWSGTQATCQPTIKCSCPPHPLHGYRSCDGEVTTYRCQAWYHLVGNTVRRCLIGHENVWTGSTPYCKRENLCECPPSPQNGKVSCDYGYYGQRFYLQCNEGYFIKRPGQSLTTSRYYSYDASKCNKDGKMVEKVTCERSIPCPCPSKPAHGHISCESEYLGGPDSAVRYWCNSGYFVKGNSQRICQINGTWTLEPPVCIREINCTCPPSPDNGYILPNCNITDGNVIAINTHLKYICNSGYYLEGGVNTTCRGDGTWSSAVPLCVKKNIRMGNRISVNEGEVEMLLDGVWGVVCSFWWHDIDSARVACREQGFSDALSSRRYGIYVGRSPVSLKDVHCIGNEQSILDCPHSRGSDEEYCNYYDVASVICLPSNNCSCPPFPLNGFVNCTRGGLYADYSCNSGYYLKGLHQRACLVDGTWTDSAPVCEEGCPCPEKPVNGDTNCVNDVARPGQQILYFCKKGYRLVGKNLRLCTLNGTLSEEFKPPVCIRDVCQCPQATNGTIITGCNQTAEVEDVIHYHCINPNYAFDLAINAARRCQTGGEWTGEDPICRPTCQCPQSSANMKITGCSTKNPVGQIITISCNKYRGRTVFNLVGSKRRTCTSSGNWSGNATMCIRKPEICVCPPSPLNGETTCPYPGFTAHHTCNSGYLLAPEIDSSQWCSPYSSTPWQPTANITCVRDFRVCSCPRAPEHGSILGCYTGRDVFRSTRMYYQCDRGYRLYGAPSRQCRGSDVWLPMETSNCVRDDRYCRCPQSPEIPNGYTSGCHGDNAFATAIQYSCLSGHVLIGDSLRECLGNDTWGGSEPKCLPGCTCPSSPTNGYTSCTSGEVLEGSVVQYYCYYDYRIEGDRIRTCHGMLGWSGNPPTCSQARVSCTCPPYPKNGYTTGCFQVANVGSRVDYKCFGGYQLVGPKTRTCSSTGSWFGDAPLCVEDDPTTADSIFETDFNEDPSYLSLAATLVIAIGVGSLVLILITGTLSVVAGIAYWRWARTSRIPVSHSSTVPLLDLNDSVSENHDVQPTPSDVQDPPTSPSQTDDAENGPVDSSQLPGLNGDESSF